jgi:hypothetical protein
MSLVALRARPGDAAGGRAGVAAEAARAPRRSPDALAALALGALLLLVVALTWRKWGTPEIDAGAELTTADRVAHGALPYEDVRYFYGPLGLYGLAATFKVLGTSFTAAFAFGLAETAAILAMFYALARRWLAVLPAALATAIVLGIAFSGTAFDYVLPHTSSAPTGTLTILLTLLAISRGRLGWAGVAAGCAALTRPEFAAIAAGVLAAATVGAWREAGRGFALRAGIRMALPALAVAGVVLGGFALEVGAAQLFTENLWPVDFIHANGIKAQHEWAPMDAASVVGLAVRLLVYGLLLGGLVAAAVRWARAAGHGPAARLAALWPLAAAGGALLLLDAAARLTSGDGGGAVEEEARHLVLGMSALPAVTLAAGAWALIRLLRGRTAPLSGSWVADLALLAAACGLVLRAYNAFTTEGSYAPYYAAPAVLVLAIVHEQAGIRWPAARTAARAALGAVAAGLLLYAYAGLYADDGATVRTARGSFVTTPAAASALQPTLDALRQTDPRRPILAAPADGGLYFMADRRPVLGDIMLLPGDLDALADERGAIARMRARGVRSVVIGARDLSAFGPSEFGVDYNRALGSFIRGATTRSRSFGEQHQPSSGTTPSRGFTVLALTP